MQVQSGNVVIRIQPKAMAYSNTVNLCIVVSLPLYQGIMELPLASLLGKNSILHIILVDRG